MFKMFRRVLLILLILLLGGYAIAEVAAANYAEKTLAAKAAEKDVAARDATADVSKPLIWGLLTRNTIDRIELTTNHVKVGPLLADQAIAVLTGVHIDREQSLKEAEPIISKIDRLDVTAVISQEAVSEALGNGVSIEFGEGFATVKAAGLEVRGGLRISGQTAIEFVPDSMPPGLPRPALELGHLPFVSCIKQIAMTPGKVTVRCSQDNPPPDFPPA